MAGCYSLDLYCSNDSNKHKYKEFPHQYYDEYGSVCRARAKRDGWVFKRNGTHLCPKCSGKRAKS